MSDNPTPRQTERTPPQENRSSAPVARGGGCLVGLVLWGVVFTFATSLDLSDAVLLVASAFTGLGLLHLYGHVARQRWKVDPPDPVELLAQDLGGLFFFSFDDYRLKFDRTWPLRERLLHEVLYWLKWLGHSLVFMGLGGVMYKLMIAFGIVAGPV